MRLILRLALVWLVVMPFVAYFGFPHLIAYTQDKTRAEAYQQCLTQTTTMPALFDPQQPQIAGQYCGCVRDGVTVTRDDMFVLLKREEPTALHQRIATTTEQCGQRLQNPREGDAQVIYF